MRFRFGLKVVVFSVRVRVKVRFGPRVRVWVRVARVRAVRVRVGRMSVGGVPHHAILSKPRRWRRTWVAEECVLVACPHKYARVRVRCTRRFHPQGGPVR